MALTLQPIRVATGDDEEGMLVIDDEGRLVAVLTHLSERHEGLSGHWFLEAGFGRLLGPDQPTFPGLDAAQAWIRERLSRHR